MTNYDDVTRELSGLTGFANIFEEITDMNVRFRMMRWAISRFCDNDPELLDQLKNTEADKKP